MNKLTHRRHWKKTNKNFLLLQLCPRWNERESPSCHDLHKQLFSRQWTLVIHLPGVVSRTLSVRFHGSTSTSKTHTRDIPAMLKEICLEGSIFMVNSVLFDLGQTEECEESAQDAERRSNPEGVLVALDSVASCVSYKDGEQVVADESTDLAKGCSDGIVATTNGSGRSLGCDETNVVARTDYDIVSKLLMMQLNGTINLRSPSDKKIP